MLAFFVLSVCGAAWPLTADQATEELFQTCAGDDAAKSENACREILRRSDVWPAAIDSEILMTRLAESAERSRNWPAAEGLWRLATERFPQNPQYQYRFGRLLVDELGRFEEAYGPLLRAVTEKPNLPDALLRLAAVQERLGQAQEAVSTYRAASRVGADAEWALTGLGRALADLRRHGEVLDLLQRVGFNAPDDDRAAFRRLLEADAQFWLGRGSDAQHTLHAASRLKLSNATEPPVQCALATVSRLLQEEREARLACEAVGGGAVCGCRVWRETPPNGVGERFHEIDADVALAALLSTSTATSGGVFVIEEETGLDFTSALSQVRDAITDRVRKATLGYPAPAVEAVRKLIGLPSANRQVWFPASQENVHVRSREALRDTFAGHRPAFDQQFPGARGLVVLSAPQYSSDGTAAAIAVQSTEQIDHPQGRFVLLQRSSTGWTVTGSFFAF